MSSTSRIFLAALCLFACRAKPTDKDDSPSRSAMADAPVVGEVTRVTGTVGVRSPDLPEGVFLGAGGKLGAGQRIEVPPGTRVEIRLTDGPLLRVNEKTSFTMPERDRPRRVQLDRGEIVVLSIATAGAEIVGGDETLEVVDGEARVRRDDKTREYSVVRGRSMVHTADKTHELSAGASLNLPGEEPGPDRGPIAPRRSLQPLQDVAWAHAFDATTKIAADAIPEGIGSLTTRRAGTSTESQRARLVDHRVHVDVVGRVARTQIEQAFFNEASEVLEGTYRFPLPADASISGLQLLVGDRWMEGAMLEKERARDVFRQIVDATIPRDPALLTWERGSVFKLKIFPMPARGERRVRLSYTQILPEAGTTLRYRYPMGGGGATETPIDHFSFSASVDRSTLPEEVTIATPMILAERTETASTVEFNAKAEHYLPSHEIGLDIPRTPQKLEATTYRDRDGQTYFMLAMEPQLDLPEFGNTAARPIDYAVVLDRSHGTTPELWTVARGLVRALGESLGSDDSISVLACDTACDRAAATPLRGGSDTTSTIDRFLDTQVLAGASDLGGMLLAGADAIRDRSGSEKVVVYLGDGMPSAGELTADALRRLVDGPLADVRLQAIALGSRSDLLVLDALASRSGGDLLRADVSDNLADRVRELVLRAHVPVVRDAHIELPPGLRDVHPRNLPALRPGDDLVLVGKIDGPVRGDLVLRGQAAGGPMTLSLPVDLSGDPSSRGGSNSHLPRTWAQEEIEHLTATQGHSARAHIIDLSRRFNVLSRYTALLVLENDAMYREFGVAKTAGASDGWKGLGGAASPGSNISSPLGSTSQGQLADPFQRPSDLSDSKDKLNHAAESASRPSPQPVSPDMDEEQRRSQKFADAGEASEPEFDQEFKPDPEAAEDTPMEQEKSWDDKTPISKPVEPSKKESNKGQISRDSMGAGDDGYYGGGKGRGGWIAVPRVTVRRVNSGEGTVSSRVDQLLATRDGDPSLRSRHRSLVHAAQWAGDPRLLTFAAAWAQSDPDHSPALTAHADALASAGDPIALRAYASAVDVNPFSQKLQAQLAEASASAGDWVRACAHRRALVSIDPKNGAHHTALQRCAGPSLQAAAPRGGTLRVELTWSAHEGELDIALVDATGKRLSAMNHGRAKVFAEPGRKVMSLGSIGRGVYVEVTRPGTPNRTSATEVRSIPASLAIRTPDETERISLDVGPGTVRVAQVTSETIRSPY